MRFNCANVKNEPPMMVRRFCCIGDGESKGIRISLKDSPVRMEFWGSVPSAAFMRDTTGPELMTLMVDGALLHLEFERPLAMHERADITVEFYYDGV